MCRARHGLSLVRILAWGVGVGALLAAGAEVVRVYAGRNVHTVLPGRVYRCAQQSPAQLDELIRRYGLRSVVNLRGACDLVPWYLDECRATHDRNVSQYDVCLSAGRLPAVQEVRHLLEILDRAEYPLVLHCKQGADRTGLVSGIVKLLETDATVAQARRQLGPRYGHLAVGRTASLDTFFDLYEEWLQARGLAHTRTAFRQWLQHDYKPAEAAGRLEPIDVPRAVPVNQVVLARVRAHNTSPRPWHFRPGTGTGVHAGVIVLDIDGNLAGVDQAGNFRADVPPGGTIDLVVPVPAVKVPGRYRAKLDLVDAEQTWFHQAGSEPIEWELEVLSSPLPQSSGGEGPIQSPRPHSDGGEG